MIALYPCVKYVGIEEQVIQDGVMFAQNHSELPFGLHMFNMDESALYNIIDSEYKDVLVQHFSKMVDNCNHLTVKEKWKLIEYLIFTPDIWIDGYGYLRTQGLDIIYIYGQIVGTQLYKLDINQIKKLNYLAINYYSIDSVMKNKIYANHKIFWKRFAYTQHIPADRVILNNLERTIKVIDNHVQRLKNRTQLVNEFPLFDVLDYSNL